MGVARRVYPCWIISCDCCGEGDENEDGGETHWPDKESAQCQVNENEDWHKQKDGDILCGECDRKKGGRQ